MKPESSMFEVDPEWTRGGSYLKAITMKSEHTWNEEICECLRERDDRGGMIGFNMMECSLSRHQGLDDILRCCECFIRASTSPCDCKNKGD